MSRDVMPAWRLNLILDREARKVGSAGADDGDRAERKVLQHFVKWNALKLMREEGVSEEDIKEMEALPTEQVPLGDEPSKFVYVMGGAWERTKGADPRKSVSEISEMLSLDADWEAEILAIASTMARGFLFGLKRLDAGESMSMSDLISITAQELRELVFEIFGEDDETVQLCTSLSNGAYDAVGQSGCQLKVDDHDTFETLILVIGKELGSNVARMKELH